MTIEEAVGYTETDKLKTDIAKLPEDKVLPTAEATSIAKPVEPPVDNSDITHILLAVAGLGILLGAVYTVKKTGNTKQISINRDTIRKKLICPLTRSDPKGILQTRLAKGEITLEEYEKICSKIN